MVGIYRYTGACEYVGSLAVGQKKAAREACRRNAGDRWNESVAWSAYRRPRSREDNRLAVVDVEGDKIRMTLDQRRWRRKGAGADETLETV